jgi:DNA-binding transcriptional ArsR family regulator
VVTYDPHGFTALADPTRRRIFERIARRPQCVNDLAAELPVSRPAVSQHLRVLKEARLVCDRRAGSRRIYEVNPSGVQELHAYLDQFWNRSLTAFKAAAENQSEENR